MTHLHTILTNRKATYTCRHCTNSVVNYTRKKRRSISASYQILCHILHPSRQRREELLDIITPLSRRKKNTTVESELHKGEVSKNGLHIRPLSLFARCLGLAHALPFCPVFKSAIRPSTWLPVAFVCVAFLFTSEPSGTMWGQFSRFTLPPCASLHLFQADLEVISFVKLACLECMQVGS